MLALTNYLCEVKDVWSFCEILPWNMGLDQIVYRAYYCLLSWSEVQVKTMR